MPLHRKRPGDGTGAIQVSEGTETKAESSRSRQQFPDVRGLCYPPPPGMTLYRVVVTDCPACGHMHTHVAPVWYELAESVRRGACGQRYRLHLSAIVVGGGVDV